MKYVVSFLLFVSVNPCFAQRRADTVEIISRVALPKDMVVNTVSDYYKIFHAPRKVVLAYGKGKDCDNGFNPNSGLIETTLNYVVKDTVLLCQSSFDRDNIDNVQNNIIHSLFYVIKPADTLFTKFSNNDTLRDGNKIIGFYGLSIIVRLKNGNIICFSKIETGCAGACAFLAKRTYLAASVQDKNVALLALQRITAHFITFDEIIKFQKTNDFIGFTAKWFNIPKQEVNISTITILMDTFMNSWKK